MYCGCGCQISNFVRAEVKGHDDPDPDRRTAGKEPAFAGHPDAAMESTALCPRAKTKRHPRHILRLGSTFAAHHLWGAASGAVIRLGEAVIRASRLKKSALSSGANRLIKII